MEWSVMSEMNKSITDKKTICEQMGPACIREGDCGAVDEAC